jgi:hypothetical protein
VAQDNGFWSDRAEWPEHFLVRLLVGDDDLRPTEHRVLTYLGPDKAIVLAVAAHVRRYGAHVSVHDVAVEPLGPAATSLDGRPERVPGALIDHREL